MEAGKVESEKCLNPTTKPHSGITTLLPFQTLSPAGNNGFTLGPLSLIDGGWRRGDWGHDTEIERSPHDAAADSRGSGAQCRAALGDVPAALRAAAPLPVLVWQQVRAVWAAGGRAWGAHCSGCRSSTSET